MITAENLEEVFGDLGKSHFEYLCNKNKGGINNSKGNTFENFFTVYRIAQSFNEGMDLEDTYVSSQDLWFIDDLIVQEVKKTTFWFYQLKDKADLKWNDRSVHSLESDFINQHKFCQSTGIVSQLHLVVSQKATHDHLISTKSVEIGDKKVQVILFETATSLNNLIRDNTLFRTEIAKMCALKEPSNDKLNALATIVLGAWDATDKKKVSLKELIDRCYAQNPHYIRGTHDQISQKLKAIFEKIDGFSYVVEGGYITWRFAKSDDGTLSYRIGSREYEQWENDIFNATINTFEDIEPFLQ